MRGNKCALLLVLGVRAGQDLGITLCDMDGLEIGRQVLLSVCSRIIMARQDSEA